MCNNLPVQIVILLHVLLTDLNRNWTNSSEQSLASHLDPDTTAVRIDPHTVRISTVNFNDGLNGGLQRWTQRGDFAAKLM